MLREIEIHQENDSGVVPDSRLAFMVKESETQRTRKSDSLYEVAQAAADAVEHYWDEAEILPRGKLVIEVNLEPSDYWLLVDGKTV